MGDQGEKILAEVISRIGDRALDVVKEAAEVVTGAAETEGAYAQKLFTPQKQIKVPKESWSGGNFESVKTGIGSAWGWRKTIGWP